ncbi:MAG TPA: phytoene/squalene synthase family protein [Planctomycetota bacterium]|nr:phytoene/squalene synthase family protein [Planctomycetota bacterium]
MRLEDSFRFCRAAARREARNFYATFLLSPPAKRDALCAVYATLRALDDVADGAGPVEEKRRALRDWREALDGARDPAGYPSLPALLETARRFEIPAEHFRLLVGGVEMDLDVRRYPAFRDLSDYCYRVASVVGLICVRIFGGRDERARPPAEACGLAFQLTNILRDVAEDAARGRIYLPLEDLARFGCSEEQVLRGEWDERFAELMRFEAARARAFYEEARVLPPLVNWSGRTTLRAMIGFYRGILRTLERRDFRVFGPRVRLSGLEKARVVAAALARNLWPEPAPAP